MQIGVAAIQDPVAPLLAVKPDAAHRRQLRGGGHGEQIVVHPRAQLDHRRVGPHAEHQKAGIEEQQRGACRVGDGFLDAAAAEPVGAPLGQLADPQPGEHHDQQHRRIDEAVFLMGDPGMHRDDRQRRGEQNRQTSRAERRGQHEEQPAAAPQAELAEQVGIPRRGPEIRADAVDHVVEDVAPQRGQRVAERQPVERRPEGGGGQPAGKQCRKPFPPDAPACPQDDNRDRRRQMDTQQAHQAEQNAGCE